MLWGLAVGLQRRSHAHSVVCIDPVCRVVCLHPNSLNGHAFPRLAL